MKVAVNTLFLIPGEVGGSETYLVCESAMTANCLRLISLRINM